MDKIPSEIQFFLESDSSEIVLKKPADEIVPFLCKLVAVLSSQLAGWEIVLITNDNGRSSYNICKRISLLLPDMHETKSKFRILQKKGHVKRTGNIIIINRCADGIHLEKT